MSRKIRVGSRDSQLAIIQSQIVIDKIKQYDSSIEVELITMKTTGDKILDKTLDKIGGKGLFIKELEYGLLNGDIDICVHSLKDMESEINKELPIAAFGHRADSRDVLVLPSGRTQIQKHLPLGSSSARRQIQLKNLMEHKVEPVRGNVLTRLEKLDRGDFAGLVLAHAGLIRLNLTNRVSRVFSIKEIIPAACQGILAVQSRRNEETPYLDLFRSPESEVAAKAERCFVNTLGVGCGAPVGVYCEVHQNEVRISGMYYDGVTDICEQMSVNGEIKKAESLGESLANNLLLRARNRSVM